MKRLLTSTLLLFCLMLLPSICVAQGGLQINPQLVPITWPWTYPTLEQLPESENIGPTVKGPVVWTELNGSPLPQPKVAYFFHVGWWWAIFDQYQGPWSGEIQARRIGGVGVIAGQTLPWTDPATIKFTQNFPLVEASEGVFTSPDVHHWTPQVSLTILQGEIWQVRARLRKHTEVWTYVTPKFLPGYWEWQWTGPSNDPAENYYGDLVQVERHMDGTYTIQIVN